MDTVFFIPIAVLLIGGAFLIGMIRNRNFDRREKLHKDLAVKLGLAMSYLNQRDFTLYGNFRGYKLRIEGKELFDSERKNPIPVIKCSIPMINPQLKILRVQKSQSDFPYFDDLAIIDRPVNMPHNIGEWLNISTNDLMFGSILLTDDIKISLYEVFNPLKAGLLYIEGEELVFVGPDLILDQERVAYYQKAVELLADVKDELNQ